MEVKGKAICLLCFLLVLAWSYPSPANEPPVREARLEPGQTTGSSRVLSLSLRDFIKRVREKNERIGYQEAEWMISQEAVKSAWSIFEPELVSSATHEKNRRRNTVEEALSQQLLGVFEERNNTYEAAVEGLVPTGARLRLGYTLGDISNNLNEGLYNIGNEYQSFVGATVTQPLLKNGGIQATMANIRIAEADSELAFQAYRRQAMQVVFDAASAYWDLYLAQERHRIRKDSVRIAAKLVDDNRARVKAGKMAETELLEAEAGLAQRRSSEVAARQDLISAMNRVRTFFSSSAGEDQIKVVAAERINFMELGPYFGPSLEKAFKLRSEYLSSRRKIEKEDVRIAFAKNQRWPQLDLKASYGLNGLDSSFGRSWDEAWSRDFESWSVGLELRLPLIGGMKSRSELEAAKQRKRQALLELKAVEVAIANDVHTAVLNVHSAREQARAYSQVVRWNRRLLDVELERLDAGKSTSREVLEREERLNRAREARAESLVRYAKAILALEMVEGSILFDYGIEVMEVEL